MPYMILTPEEQNGSELDFLGNIVTTNVNLKNEQSALKFLAKVSKHDVFMRQKGL